MMKGVSPVVATVLMAAITIAAAVVAYSWFMSMQASVQADASRGAGAIGSERIMVEEFSCDSTSGNELDIYVKNLGTEDIVGNFTVIVEDASRNVILHREEEQGVTISAGSSTTLEVGPITGLSNCKISATGSGEVSVRVTTPSGVVASWTRNIG